MTIISAKLYKALKSAGVDETLAEQASEEVINFDKKIDTLDNDLNKKFDKLDARMDKLEAKFNIMLGLMSGTFLMMLGLFVQNLIK